MAAGSVWDEIFDTGHAEVVRTYIERWPRKDRQPEKVLIVVVQPDEEHRWLCPHCGGRREPVEWDTRRWRTLDMHGKRCFLEADLPRVVCGEQRVTWDAVASMVGRVCADAAAGRDRLGGLRRIGIDEKSWGKREDQYLIVVTDHDAGTIAWMGEGRCQATVEKFFADLGPERAGRLTDVSADGAQWIHDVVRAKAPRALISVDAFHVVKWAGEKLDELRRRLAGELRAAGREDQAATLGKGLRALRKKPENLTGSQRTALAGIKRDNRHLYTGYLIKEQVREMFKVKGDDGKALLTGVIAWAQRSRIPELAKFAKTLVHYKPLIENTLAGGPSNGRAEALNSQLNALITRARGFRSATALMNMASFVHGGLCPDSPYA